MNEILNVMRIAKGYVLLLKDIKTWIISDIQMNIEKKIIQILG